MKKIIVLTLIACVLMFANTSCHKDADYVLHVGEGFCLYLEDVPDLNYFWEWENSDETDVVSLKRGSSTAVGITSDTTLTVGMPPVVTQYYFRAEKKGYTVVKMVLAKGDRDFERRINFSICVID